MLFFSFFISETLVIYISLSSLLSDTVETIWSTTTMVNTLLAMQVSFSYLPPDWIVICMGCRKLSNNTIISLTSDFKRKPLRELQWTPLFSRYFTIFKDKFCWTKKNFTIRLALSDQIHWFQLLQRNIFCCILFFISYNLLIWLFVVSLSRENL